MEYWFCGGVGSGGNDVKWDLSLVLVFFCWLEGKVGLIYFNKVINYSNIGYYLFIVFCVLE